LQLRNELLLLHLQLLQSRVFAPAGLVAFAVGSLHHVSLLEQIDLQLLLKMMHELLQLLSAGLRQLLEENGSFDAKKVMEHTRDSTNLRRAREG